MSTYFLSLTNIILNRTFIVREKRKKLFFCEYYGKGIDNQAISNVSLNVLLAKTCATGTKVGLV